MLLLVRLSRDTPLIKRRRWLHRFFQRASDHSVQVRSRASLVQGIVNIGRLERPFCIVMRFTSAKADTVGELRLYAPGHGSRRNE